MLSEVDVALSVLDAFFAGNSPDYPPNNAYKTLKAAVLAQQSNNGAMDAIALACVEACCKAYREGAIYVNDMPAFARKWLKQQHQ